jgi:hypothetical protein
MSSMSGEAGGAQRGELRAAWEEQLRLLTPADVIVQTAVSLISLAGRRLGLEPGPRASAISARCATRSTGRARCCRCSNAARPADPRTAARGDLGAPARIRESSREPAGAGRRRPPRAARAVAQAAAVPPRRRRRRRLKKRRRTGRGPPSAADACGCPARENPCRPRRAIDCAPLSHAGRTCRSARLSCSVARCECSCRRHGEELP